MSTPEGFLAWARLLPEPLLLLDQSGSILAGNAPAAALFGLNQAELGGPLADLCSEREPVEAFLGQARRVTNPIPGRLKIRLARGEISARCTGCVMLDGDHRAILLRFTPHDEHDRFLLLKEKIEALTSEVMRRRVAERDLAQMYEGAQRETLRAEEASRLKDEFLAIVSHELRTPLTAILGWTAILRTDRRSDPASVVKGVQVIERNARSQLRIIEDILDVSRIIRGQLRLDTEAVDLDALCREVLESVQPAANAKSIQLAFEPCEGPCRLVADPERLRQILWNLLSNAVKFTPGRGLVRLSIEQVGSKITIRVRDTGSGIDPAFLPHVFERFRQADGSASRSHGGLGLGLAIVRHLIEAHGGTAAAESDGPGLGATFTATLPVKPLVTPPRGGLATVRHALEVASTAYGAPAEKLSLTLAGARVLLVEDEDDSREMIALVLSTDGAIVHPTSSAADAVSAIDAFRPDVVVSDIGMPVHDGYWLIQRLRDAHPKLPAIALTAFSRSVDVDRAVAAGFNHHLGKPVDPDRLIETIAKCLVNLEPRTPPPPRC